MLLLAMSGSQAPPERTLPVVATAYCLRGLTATGTRARPGVCAVDPRVIPLGSRVRIHGKWYRAEDTGRAIRGRRIDLWLPSRGLCVRWGRRRVTAAVYLPAKSKKPARAHQGARRGRKIQRRGHRK